MPRQAASPRFLTLPENRSAVLAVRQLLAHLRNEQPFLLYLHGPSGVGKSLLVAQLVREACAHGTLTVTAHSAADLRLPTDAQANTAEVLEQARNCDLWVLEDLHHLPPQAMEMMVQLLEHRSSHDLATVITALVGPRDVKSRERFPARLTSRLAAGLAVALDPWQEASRLLFLEERVQRRQLPLDASILQWLAQHLPGSGRVLEGALHQLETLASSSQRKRLDLAQVTRHFHSEAEARQPTVERIVRKVSGFYRLDPEDLLSRCRYRNILLPRQVGMYLARQLTGLSLEQIGALFGGRDHTTVLHACRKVEQALPTDPVLSGALRQIHTQLA